ncbi:MAG: hypothetical protein WD555_04705, partial [Fulvivirga sp.]
QDIGIDFHSNAEYPNSVNNSFSQIQATEVPFFEASGLQDLDDINQKASEATVAVHAKLTALNQLPVEPADWFDEHLVCDLLDESSAKQDILSPEERQLYRSKLKYRIQKLYLINGFQLKIELMNCFTKAEYDLLSAQKVKCFPFYFDLNVQCRQKIIQRSDGSLEIYLHCDKDLPVVIAADLKQLYRL